MNLNNKPECQQKLAAEYVLGTLRGGARRRFETWMAQDAGLKQIVKSWQDSLLPLAEFPTPVTPPPRVWKGLEQQLNLQLQKQDRWSYWRNLREDLGFWRGLAMTSTTAAVIMVSVLVSQQAARQSGQQLAALSDSAQEATPATNYVATLSDDKSQPVAVVTGDLRRRQLLVHMIASQQIGAGKSLELWAVSRQGSVRSLGLMNEKGKVVLSMPAGMTAENTPLLAVTLEPKGGSGNPEKPSGPIVYKGNWLQLS